MSQQTESEQPTFPSLEGQVFIYNLNMAFSHPHSDGGHIDVEPLTLKATNVVQTDAKRWEFNLEGFEQRFQTHYGWSLYHDTPENRELIAAYVEAQKLSDQATAFTNIRRELISKLGGSPDVLGKVMSA